MIEKYRGKGTPIENSMREKCGVFGIFDPTERMGVTATYLALIGLQHRGQDGAGIASGAPGNIQALHGDGLVLDVFKEGRYLSGLPSSKVTVGHNSYNTNGTEVALQPIVDSDFVLAHNGHIEELAHDPHKTDTQVLSDLIQSERPHHGSFADAVAAVLVNIKGAYSLVLSDGNQLIGVRDPHGFRPLVMGRSQDGQHCFSSEDSVLRSIGLRYERAVRPGEMVVVDGGGVQSRAFYPEKEIKQKTCMFEFIYFARPDSRIDERSVQSAREEMGTLLAAHETDNFRADMVIGVPDSGIPAALGYSRRAGIPFELALVKNRYISRTFIKATQADREQAVRMKLNINPDITRGKQVVVIDDSIIRGTTMRALISMIREEGEAAGVHIRISSPPYKWPCYYGMSTSDPDQLIANTKDKEGVRRYLGADSLEYLSVRDTKQAIGSDQLCDACATGEYPTDPKTMAS